MLNTQQTKFCKECQKPLYGGFSGRLYCGSICKSARNIKRKALKLEDMRAKIIEKKPTAYSDSEWMASYTMEFMCEFNIEWRKYERLIKA